MNSDNRITRREFIETSGLVATMLIHPSVSPATSETSASRYSRRLLTGWEFHPGSLGGIWEVWRGKGISDNRWQATGGRIVLELWARDPNQVLCLDARNRIRFEIAGEGSLQDNLGTVSGSRVVELRNGRAQATVLLRRDCCVVSASTEGLPTAFLLIRRSP